MSVWGRLLRGVSAEPPPGFAGRMDPDERIVTTGELADSGHLVLTQLGLWVPEGTEGRRVGWHLVSKAVWDHSALVITEAVSAGRVGAAVLLSDLPPRGFVLAAPGKVPEVVRQRVTGSIRSSQRCELPGGGAWFVQRRVPGQDGLMLQVRADPGTAPRALESKISEVLACLSRLAPPI
ncbi:MAG TPA: hypothetical protein VFO16_07675 [Pseudonocardiaceae bacterium]|nr:hypothetical protein [Pseudonocardiaceae bacterium]